jgi:vancomycin resistance protein YoaR
MAVRRSPKFRFDYFLRSLPVDVMGRRCEHLLRAAEKEVEQLEKKVREEAGLPVEAEDGKELPPVELKPFKEMQRQRRVAKKKETETEKQQLEGKVDGLESQMKEIQDRLKELSKDIPDEYKENTMRNNGSVSRKRPQQDVNEVEEEEPEPEIDESKGAVGPDGDLVEFPEYDGTAPPKEHKKAFTHFCMTIRKEVKASLDPSERGIKVSYCSLIWLHLSDFVCSH